MFAYQTAPEGSPDSEKVARYPNPNLTGTVRFPPFTTRFDA
jgi:hypothetical protein